MTEMINSCYIDEIIHHMKKYRSIVAKLKYRLPQGYKLRRYTLV